jgi:WD40 repeat protein
MKMERRTITAIGAACIVLIAAAACAPSPAAWPTTEPTSYLQTMEAILSATAEALHPGPAHTPTWDTLSRWTPTIPPADTPDESPTAFGAGTSLVLPGWVPQGARARLGRGEINQVAISPDGNAFAVAGTLGLSFYAMDTFEEIWSVPTAKNIGLIAFSPDGKTISTAVTHNDWSTNGCPQILDAIATWDGSGGRLLNTLSVEEQDVGSMAFSPDGKRLAVGHCASGDVNLWDLPAGVLADSLAAEEIMYTTSLAFSADGVRLAAGSADGLVVLWDPVSGENPQILGTLPTRVRSLAFSPAGDILAAAAGNTVTLWNASTGIRLRSLGGKGEEINAVAFSRDGKMIASGGDEGSVLRWDPHSGGSFDALRELRSTVKSLAFSIDGTALLGGSADAILLWNSGTGAYLRTIDRTFAAWESAGFLSGGTQIAILSDRIIAFADVYRNEIVSAYEIPAGALFAQDYRMYAYLPSCQEIALHETVSGKFLRSIRMPAAFACYPGSVAISPDGRTAASINQGPEGITADIWDTVGASKIRTLIPPDQWAGLTIRFSPDGKRVALGQWNSDYGEVIAVHDIATGQLVNQFASRNFLYVDFSYDGNAILTDCEETAGLCLYDIVSGELLQKFSLSDDGISCSVFSADGKNLIFGTRSGELVFFDIGLGSRLGALKAHNGAVQSVSISPDSKVMVSAGDGSVLQWVIGE